MGAAGNGTLLRFWLVEDLGVTAGPTRCGEVASEGCFALNFSVTKPTALREADRRPRSNRTLSPTV